MAISMNKIFLITFCAVLLGGLLMQEISFAAQSKDTASADRVALAEKNKGKLFGNTEDSLAKSDPELVAMKERLIYGEIAEHGSLNDKQRELITLVVLTSAQTPAEIKKHAGAALQVGVTPIEIKEALYQCAPYIGFPKVETAIQQINEVFAERKIALPLASQATVTEESRFKDGLAVQKSIFHDAIDKMHAATPENQKELIVNYLSSFCFGDTLTRKGLDIKTRELLVFSAISALGGCESQVKSHVQGNINVGNSKQNLIDALVLSLPYIGFPRTLNALACINEVISEQ